jgi:putative DNA primase/helicase
MVSSDNPEDPSAVLCSRISDRSVREVSEAGYLHIFRSNTTATSGKAVLWNSGDPPILIVEGASDVLAALDLGFTAIGKPSAKGGMSILREMPLAGKEVWVIGENDAGAGKEGMDKTMLNLKSAVEDLMCVMPPEGVKDLRQWVKRGLTQESLYAYIGQYGHATCDDPNIFPNGAPRTIAKRFLEQFEVDGARTLRRHNGMWAEWKDGRYAYVDKNNKHNTELSGLIYRYLDGKQFIKSIKGVDTPLPYEPTKKMVGDIIHAMNGDYPVEGVSPIWLEQRGRPDTQNLIAFKNGILDVDEYCRTGEPKMLPLTPELFTVARIPYNYDPTSWSPLLDKYCETSLNGDDESIKLLAQWLGYLLVYDISMRKFMILIGPTTSGKSTIITAAKAMLGREQWGLTSLSRLGRQFGLSSLVGKSAAFVGDIKGMPRKAEMDAALETLLMITGQDDVPIEAKFKDQYEALMMCRFTMAMNDLPAFTDNSKAILTRALVLCFPNNYEGKEDFSLIGKLEADAAEGKIINFALWGLKSLRESGRFAEPEISKQEKHKMILMTSPMTAFVTECCLISNDVEISKQQLYEAYKVWCGDRSKNLCGNVRFGRWLAQEIPVLGSAQRGSGRERECVYTGVTLTESAFQNLLGRP